MVGQNLQVFCWLCVSIAHGEAGPVSVSSSLEGRKVLSEDQDGSAETIWGIIL